MNNCCCSNNDEISRILKNIVRMQKEAVREELGSEMCDDRTLGCTRREKINTRPFELFTLQDRPWHCPIRRNDIDCNEDLNLDETCVFRVEKVEGCTATFRCLVPVGHEEGGLNADPCRPGKYKSTDSFITIKLGNIAAIRCFNDTFVDLSIR